jgi:hypothetical protein
VRIGRPVGPDERRQELPGAIDLLGRPLDRVVAPALPMRVVMQVALAADALRLGEDGAEVGAALGLAVLGATVGLLGGLGAGRLGPGLRVGRQAEP